MEYCHKAYEAAKKECEKEFLNLNKEKLCLEKTGIIQVSTIINKENINITKIREDIGLYGFRELKKINYSFSGQLNIARIPINYLDSLFSIVDINNQYSILVLTTNFQEDHENYPKERLNGNSARELWKDKRFIQFSWFRDFLNTVLSNFFQLIPKNLEKDIFIETSIDNLDGRSNIPKNIYECDEKHLFKCHAGINEVKETFKIQLAQTVDEKIKEIIEWLMYKIE